MQQDNFDYTLHLKLLVPLLKELEAAGSKARSGYSKIIKKYKHSNGHLFAKDQVISAYRQLAGAHGLKPFNQNLVKALQMKPTRTISGVTPVTVLTKPFPCPGKCIFCPNDVRMPKSYLSDEPGAQRAERNYFDPYLQTYNRLQALHNIGHTIDKTEIIVLGGTWSYYPESYQIWFIKECFKALNDFSSGVDKKTQDGREEILDRYEQMAKRLKEMDAFVASADPVENKKNTKKSKIDGTHLDKSYNQTISQMYVAPERKAGFDKYQSATWEELETEQRKNETALVRCVGLVVETRPDNISQAEIKRIRRLGCTKTQIGFQSLQDDVLEKNKRGHDVAATRRAVGLLRQAGFKIHAHWMANLYGSSVEKDKADYLKLFNDPDFKPDELKIYPCSLIASAELMQYYQSGKWKPYTYQELLEVLTFALTNTPAYCRLTRVIRDIPSQDIVEGNKLTNFRQIAEQALGKAGHESKDIRAREIRNEQFDPKTVRVVEERYQTSTSEEIFIQLVAKVASKDSKPKKAQEKLLAFLRLSLPIKETFIEELEQAAIIREIHVYGQTVSLGEKEKGKAQHLGFGSQLIKAAQKISSDRNFEKLSVISAVGTREYYRKKGFSDGELYQHLSLST